jgi:isoleucyl-tRNA synthetase
MVLNGKAQTKEILTHGFMLDEQKQKMSKSVGNVVSPEQLLQKYGRDILRLWIASADYENDLACSDQWLNNTAEAYRKIRNTCRFMLSNLYDFDINNDMVEVENLHPLDQYALATLFDLNNQIHEAYKAHKFSQVFHLISNYCTTDLSALYLDIVKDRLYLEKPNSTLRRSAQTALYQILDTLTRLVAPILSFTAEELSDHYQKDKTKSIHLQNFSEVLDIWGILGDRHVPELPSRGLMVINTGDYAMFGIKMNNAWVLLKELRDAVLKFIEAQRTAGNVKHSLEAKVSLAFDKDSEQFKALTEFFIALDERKIDVVRFLRDWFIVSELEFLEDATRLAQAEGSNWIWASVQHVQGDKCPRCWQWEEFKTQELCSRCRKVVQE